MCVGLVFNSKNVQFHITCSFKYNISINATVVDPHSDSLQKSVVKPKFRVINLGVSIFGLHYNPNPL